MMNTGVLRILNNEREQKERKIIKLEGGNKMKTVLVIFLVVVIIMGAILGLIVRSELIRITQANLNQLCQVAGYSHGELQWKGLADYDLYCVNVERIPLADLLKRSNGQ